ncbi:MAG: sigma-70 family RNA polymerase sigma factor [Myxococcales bacterium]|nr:sigma-70 family RNA polymerase sigma factor [Myxococcales bacterium]
MTLRLNGDRLSAQMCDTSDELETNRSWLEAFRAGHPEALSRVYRRYYPEVIRFLRRGFHFSSGGRACQYFGAKTAFELEDYLQEIFVRAFADKARRNYDGITPYMAYVLTIGKNLIVDDFRRKERGMISFGWVPVERPAEPSMNVDVAPDDPAELAERREFAQLVEQTVAALPPREHQIYRLRFLEELEHKEIARRTGYSVAKVKTSEERIRKMFFKNMRAQGHLEGYEERNRGWLRLVRRTPYMSRT